MRLVIVRHGEPNYERDCLTDLGHEQARLAAERLRDEEIEEIFTSPMGRARETAAYTAERLGIKNVGVLDFMSEVRWGSVDGSPIFAGGHPWSISDEIVRRGLNLCDESWRGNDFFRNNLVTAECDKVARGTDEWLRSLGYEREGLYYRNMRRDEAQHTVALFCHGGSSSAMISHVLNQTFPYVCATLHVDFTGITILRFDRFPGSLCIPSLEIACDSRHILRPSNP